MASFVLEDKLADSGKGEDDFPQDQVVLFIETLSEEIPHDQKKREFVKTLTEVLEREKHG